MGILDYPRRPKIWQRYIKNCKLTKKTARINKNAVGIQKNKQEYNNNNYKATEGTILLLIFGKLLTGIFKP